MGIYACTKTSEHGMTDCLSDADRLGLFDDYEYERARILLSRSTIRSNTDEEES